MAKQAKQLRTEKDEVLKLQEQRHTAELEELSKNALLDAEHASRLEKALNFCFPKSLILYAEKRAGAAG